MCPRCLEDFQPEVASRTPAHLLVSVWTAAPFFLMLYRQTGRGLLGGGTRPTVSFFQGLPVVCVRKEESNKTVCHVYLTCILAEISTGRTTCDTNKVQAVLPHAVHQ